MALTPLEPAPMLLSTVSHAMFHFRLGSLLVSITLVMPITKVKVVKPCIHEPCHPSFLSLAWYQWYPDNKTPHFLDTLAVSAGDSIDVVITSSTTSAVVTFWNYNNDQTETVSLTSVHALCGRDAGWIVQENTSPPVGFGMVNFTDAVAFGPSGLIYTPGDANSDLLSPQWSVQPEGDSLTVMPI